MKYLTQPELEFKASIAAIVKKELTYIVQDQRIGVKTIFLSHSHNDRKLVDGLLGMLNEQGVFVYVDWQDADMPRITSAETAKKIKEKIKEFDLFLLLATENSLNSRWVPWELGIADSQKQTTSIAILPTSSNTTLYGNEYVKIYNRVLLDNEGNLIVVQPENKYWTMKTWLGL